MKNEKSLIYALHTEIDILMSILVKERLINKYFDKDGNLLPETLWIT